jgi:hypothetical protein
MQTVSDYKEVNKMNRMNNWCLIQRCSANLYPEGKKGVDKILSFDYMGAAEFEFGALGTTIKQFRNLKGAITCTKSSLVTKYNKPVWIVAPMDADFSEIENRLAVLSKDKMQLKERSYFDYWFNKMTKEVQDFHDYKKDITSWLVLESVPVFFSVDEGTARKMLAELKLKVASAAA